LRRTINDLDDDKGDMFLDDFPDLDLNLKAKKSTV
jgi:hypothetical protein